MQLEKLIEIGFMALISGLLSYISHSVVKLTNQVSILIERSDWHKLRLNNLDKRITKLEERELYAAH